MSRNSKGRYYSPTPLDFEILARLPEKGIIGGVHWAGVQVRHIVRDINAGLPDGVDRLTENGVSSRLRSMTYPGYVENFAAVGGRIWAKTPEGAAFERTRAEVLGV